MIIGLLILANCDNTSTQPKDEDTGSLVINEFLTGNDTTNADQNGDYDDWVELYNGSAQAIDIGGMYISDDPLDLVPWMISLSEPDSTTIQPGGFLLLWCDEEPDQGVLHVDIKLSVSGEAIILWSPDKLTVVDSLTYRPQIRDVSWGRTQDGSDLWHSFTHPTPGASNTSESSL